VKRLVTVIVAVLTSFATLAMAAVGAQAKPTPPGSGNSTAAHACQKGGWHSLVGPNGETFTTGGGCVSYAARGGTLTTTSLVASHTDCATAPSDVAPNGITCTLTVQGAGLQPGAPVFLCFTESGCAALYGSVNPDGTYFSQTQDICSPPTGWTFYFESTTVSGATIDSNPVACSL
jgi:hypothetical protein